MSEPFDPVAYINTPRWRSSDYGLERIELLLDKLGRPDRDVRIVHVAGTNGKGSTCSYLASILESAGYRTGLFTSPYIERFEERIRVNGHDISREELSRAVEKVREPARDVERLCGTHPTEFELMTAVALVHFATSSCDWVVLEAGLGGRLDSTNAVAPEVSVITRIGLDHTELLGETVTEIAREKGGIIKDGIPVVSYPQDDEARSVIETLCYERNAPLKIVDLAELSLEPLDPKGGMRAFAYRGMRFETRMLGAYQPSNAAVAIEAARVALTKCDLPLSRIDDALIRGVRRAAWPGRFEVASRNPLVVLDGGHNAQGARALVESLGEMGVSARRGGRKAHFVMGVLADKDHRAMVEQVVPLARSFAVYTPDSPRALAAAMLQAEIRECGGEALVYESATEAMRRTREQAGPEDIIVAFGTLYALADIRKGLGAATP